MNIEKTNLNPWVLVLLLLANLTTCTKVKGDETTPTIGPEQIRELPPFPKEYVEELKKHENFDLATGKVRTVSRDQDKYGNTDIGYGFTRSEIEDAVKEGFLTSGTTLPRTMTKEEADWHFLNVTLPTYRSIVRKTVRVTLTIEQEFSLTAFVQNTGRSNLRKLVNGENRLNDGNEYSVVTKMPLYYGDGDLKTRCDFQLAVYRGKPFKPKT